MTQPTPEQAQHNHPAGAELSWDAADFGPEHYATPEEVDAMTQDVTEE